MSKREQSTIFLAFSLFFLASVSSAQAARLYLLPEGKAFGIGKEFSVEVKVDTEGAGINAAQATIEFPTGVVEAVSADKTNSIFNFWLEEPVISNERGTVSFIGGTQRGVSGSSLQVLKLKFKATGAGQAVLKVSNAAVTASDGKGTNVLSAVQGATVSIGTAGIEPAGEGEQPQKVLRLAAPAKGLPEKPKLRVPLYPDPSRWYNHLGEVVVFWELPQDVLAVATRVSRSQEVRTTDAEKELFTGKSFGTLMEEGIWYAGVRFRNNVGWGEAAFTRIAIDTSAPLPFEIAIDNETSDNPSPEIRFEASDSRSGIADYLIFIDGTGPTHSTSTSMRLPVQPPGKHRLVVRALDFAGNSIEDDLEFEVLPLPVPTIEFVTRAVPQGEVLYASGKAVTNAQVELRLTTRAGQEVFTGTAPSDGSGNWSLTLAEQFPIGVYELRANVKDSRGATSYATEPQEVRVKAQTVFSLGPVDLGWFEIALIVALFLIGGAATVSLYYLKRRQIRAAYAIVAARDVEKLTALLENDLKELGNWERSQKDVAPRVMAEIESFHKKMADTIGKMKKYLSQEIGRLK